MKKLLFSTLFSFSVFGAVTLGMIFENMPWKLGFDHKLRAGDTFRVYTNGAPFFTATNFVLLGTTNGVSTISVQMPGFSRGSSRVTATTIGSDGNETAQSDALNLSIDEQRAPFFLRPLK